MPTNETDRVVTDSELQYARLVDEIRRLEAMLMSRYTTSISTADTIRFAYLLTRVAELSETLGRLGRN
jgi:hypothetical protein